MAAAAASTTASSNPPVRSVDLGGSKPVKVGGGPAKMAFFMANSNTPYAAALIQGEKDAAKKHGVSLTVFDAHFDPVEQTQQMQTALASGKFNSWSIASISPQGCSIVKQAIAKGVVVSAPNQQICVPLTTFGENTYYPGTVNYIGGDQTQMIPRYINKIGALNPGKQKMIFLTGPVGLGQTTIADQSVAALQKARPDFKVVTGRVPTYDLAGAQKDMQSLLAANPDVTIVATLYSDMTQGAVLALKQLGKTGVKIYDTGGSKWAYQAVKDGTIEFTTPNLPLTMGGASVDSLYSTWYDGTPGPRYVDVLKLAGFDGDKLFITKANVANSKPQF
jgi:ribose transport system substrate-binding protein